MAQLFPRSSNSFVRAGLAGVLLLAGGVAWAGFRWYHSPLTTLVGVPLEQPVPFSHQHHVSGLGIDCRYCHTGVETSAFAGLPPTETCMTCHSQVWRDAPVLAPVRQSWATGQPIHWRRVNDLPDYSYFNHSIHVAKGVACVTCHGAVGEMPLTWKGQSLYMEWCLECHRDPARQLSPASEIFQTRLSPRTVRRDDLVAAHQIDSSRLSDCSTCHR